MAVSHKLSDISLTCDHSKRKDIALIVNNFVDTSFNIDKMNNLKNSWFFIYLIFKKMIYINIVIWGVKLSRL